MAFEKSVMTRTRYFLDKEPFRHQKKTEYRGTCGYGGPGLQESIFQLSILGPC